MTDNLDADLYPDKLSALTAALDDMGGKGTLTVCRGDWSKCTGGGICAMCARIKIVPGLTVFDVLAISTGHSA